ncbi:MAG TPA: TniB family NTP-binding protein [Ktedonobacterales bacterium]|nr:TniB family NTP-binding protein [Ktedonobacterales bacterium]
METPAATKLDTQINVRQRLKDLAIWQEEWKNHNAFFDMLIGAMEENPSQIDLQRAAEISRLRRRLELQQVRIPFEIPVETIKEMGYAALHRDLVTQYTQLTKADRLLWLNNLLFLLTPELRELKDKIARVRGWRSGGQQRNFLLGGDTGTGKTTFLDWFDSHFIPEVERERNHVPIIHIDAPEGTSPRFLLQRIIRGCGMNYLERDNEETLLMKVVYFFQRCGVELLIVDEVEHIKAHSVRRRLLEVSNLTLHIPIICASCEPHLWIEGDSEIAGRWNDYVRLHPYTGIRFQQLLSLINLLLPFPQSSFILPSARNQGSSDKEGNIKKTAFLEEVTKGLLRDLMPLLIEASKEAIQRDLPCLDLELLELTWKKIRTKEAVQSYKQGR